MTRQLPTLDLTDFPKGARGAAANHLCAIARDFGRPDGDFYLLACLFLVADHIGTIDVDTLDVDLLREVTATIKAYAPDHVSQWEGVVSAVTPVVAP